MRAACALRIIRGISFLFGIQKSLRAILNTLFTSGAVTVNCICSVAFCESAALRQTFRLNCKVTGFARGSHFEERLPPLRGKMSPQVTKGGVWRVAPERARRRTGDSAVKTTG